MIEITRPEFLSGRLAEEIEAATSFQDVVVLDAGDVIRVDGAHDSNTEPVLERVPRMEEWDDEDDNHIEQQVYIDGEPQWDYVPTGKVQPRRMNELDRATVEAIVADHDPVVLEVSAFSIPADGTTESVVTYNRRPDTAPDETSFVVNGEPVVVGVTDGVAELGITTTSEGPIDVEVDDCTVRIDAI